MERVRGETVISNGKYELILSNRTTLQTIDKSFKMRITKMRFISQGAFSGTGNQMAIATNAGIVRVYDLRDMGAYREYSLRKYGEDDAYGVWFSGDEKMLVICMQYKQTASSCLVGLDLETGQDRMLYWNKTLMYPIRHDRIRDCLLIPEFSIREGLAEDVCIFEVNMDDINDVQKEVIYEARFPADDLCAGADYICGDDKIAIVTHNRVLVVDRCNRSVLSESYYKNMWTGAEGGLFGLGKYPYLIIQYGMLQNFCLWSLERKEVVKVYNTDLWLNSEISTDEAGEYLYLPFTPQKDKVDVFVAKMAIRDFLEGKYDDDLKVEK